MWLEKNILTSFDTLLFRMEYALFNLNGRESQVTRMKFLMGFFRIYTKHKHKCKHNFVLQTYKID